MLSVTPNHDATSAAPRGGTELMDHLHAWLLFLPRPRRRWVGSPVLAVGLATALAIGSIVPVARQTAPVAAASSLSAQAATPTPTPTPMATPIPLILIDDPSVTIQGTVVPVSVDPSQLVQTGAGPLVQTTAVARGDCVSPDFIFQGCPFEPLAEPEAERRLEERAIALVLDQYQLPASERPRILRYARNEVRAALYVDIQEAFQTQTFERSPDQQLLVDVFTRLVRDLHVRAMKQAQNEYNAWALDPCRYEPPPGFTYDARSACIGASQLFRPESPGLQAFVSYGAKRAYEEALGNDPRSGAAFWLTSNAAVLGYGAFGALTGSMLGSTVGIFLPKTAVGALTTLARGAAMVATSGANFVGTVVGVLVAALTALAVASRSLSTEVPLPDDLQTLVDRAASYDVEWIMRTCNDVVKCAGAGNADLRSALDQELLAVLSVVTNPDHPGTEPAPAAQPGDPRFVAIRPGESFGTPTDWLRYKSDDQDGSARAVRLSGSWFADKADGAGDGEARLTLSIGFKDASGATWTTRRVGDLFLIVRTGISALRWDYPAARTTANLTLVEPSGTQVTAYVGR